MPGGLNPALKAVSNAVLAVAAQRSVEEVLQELVDRARELADARYAALGTPDGEGGFSRFLVSGMSDELVAGLGPLPRTHGLLGAMLESSAPSERRICMAIRAFAGGGRSDTRTCGPSSACRSSRRKE